MQKTILKVNMERKICRQKANSTKQLFLTFSSCLVVVNLTFLAGFELVFLTILVSHFDDYIFDKN